MPDPSLPDDSSQTTESQPPETNVGGGRCRVRLADFLKWTGWCDTGGQAKAVIQAGEVCVNGQIETRRRRQLFDGDRVRFGGQEAVVDDKL